MLRRKKNFIKVKMVHRIEPIELVDSYIDPNCVVGIVPVIGVEYRSVIYCFGMQMQIAEDAEDFYLRISPFLGEQFERDDQ